MKKLAWWQKPCTKCKDGVMGKGGGLEPRDGKLVGYSHWRCRKCGHTERES